MNATLQKNILFGKDLIQKKYDNMLDATTLRKDLEMLAAGDQTEIGEKVGFIICSRISLCRNR
jgi:hypothetical protein